jgi:hypothetical protein
MTSRSPLIGVAALCGLLALATSASAECAWVLWLNHTGVVAGEELAMWIPLNASMNNPDCRQVLAATLQANRRAANPGDAVTLRGSNMIDIVSAAGLHTLLYVCLPDTVDPRGPKGK